MKRQLIAGLVVMLAAAPVWAQAPQTLPYGSRAGMDVSITGRDGIDGPDAVVHVVHTRDNARAYCEYSVNDASERCILDALKEVAAQIGNRVITGNCQTGDFTGLWGMPMRFEGSAGSWREYSPQWVIRSVDEDAVLDGSLASGYDVQLSQFEALCPGRLHARQLRPNGKIRRSAGLRSQSPAHISTPR